MDVKKNNSADTSDREIKTTRVFAAPRELVFRMWTEPEHVARWWGPNGFTNTIQRMDVRPGGVWQFVMHGPDGTDYQNLVRFIEVVEPERLVYMHGSDLDPDQFHVTVLFEKEGENNTRLSMRSVFRTSAERDEKVEKIGAIEGMRQTLDRLGAYLSKVSPDYA